MKETKNVPQLRFSGFSDNWKEVIFSEIFTERHDISTITKDYPQLSFTIAEGVIRPEDRKTNQRDFLIKDKENKQYLKTELNDLIYNPANVVFGAIHRNGLGNGVLSPIYKIFYTNEDSVFLEGIVRNPEFIKKIANQTEGTVTKLKTLKPENFLQMRSFISPYLQEQQKIGTFLSHVDSLIQAKTKKLESLKAVKKSLLQKCFPKAGEKVPEIRFAGFSGDWEEKKLTDEVELYSGLTYTPKDVEEYGTLVLRSSNVQNGEIELEDNVFVDPKVVNSKNVEKGDIIVVVRNGSRALIGKHAQIKTTMHNTVIGAFMTGIKAPNPEFMNALLSTDTFTREVEINLGATINQITNSTFESMSFYFPKTIEEQQALGSFFSKYDSLVSSQQKEINKLKDIKKSLLQKMFV